jgi:hypothetical protein
MRRILLGGLGLALGVFAQPAFAQQPTQTRAARLGAPVAVPESNPEITPAGLLDRKPLFGPPAAASPAFATTPQPGALPLPAPRTLGSTPNLTEIRGPVSGGVPVSPGIPTGTPTPIYSGVPMGSVVPSMVPEDCPVELGAPATGVPALDRLGACRNPRWWVSGEYLLWWTRSTQLPTLVTTSLPGDNGILGAPTTVPVFGGSFGQTLHAGARFGGGWWFSDEQYRGIDWRFMFLFRNGNSFATNTNAYPVLARPFFNVNNPVGPFSEIIGAPGLATGGVVVNLDNSLWGAEVNYRRYLSGNACARLDGIAGFRYLNFTENLSITESFVRTPDSPLNIGTPATSGIVSDTFRAENNFYGGQVGLTGELRRGRWFVNGRSTIAFGTVHQTATIAGGQALTFADGSVGQYPGGLLALPGANSGSISQAKFAVMPEVGLNLGYHITPHLRAYVGYNFLYLSNVLRASGTIDPNLDAARIPNFPIAGTTAPVFPVRPTTQYNTTDFWAQGINFGLQWSW